MCLRVCESVWVYSIENDWCVLTGAFAFLCFSTLTMALVVSRKHNDSFHTVPAQLTNVLVEGASCSNVCSSVFSLRMLRLPGTCSHLLHTNIRIYSYIPTYIPTYIHTYIHTCTHEYIQTHSHAYTNACIHTDTLRLTRKRPHNGLRDLKTWMKRLMQNWQSKHCHAHRGRSKGWPRVRLESEWPRDYKQSWN